MNTEALTLGDILDDLTRILATVVECSEGGRRASYDIVQQRLGGDIELSLLSYVRFLETHGYISYDRIGDRLQATDDGHFALEAPTTLAPMAEVEFAEHLFGDDDPSEPQEAPVFEDSGFQDSGFEDSGLQDSGFEDSGFEAGEREFSAFLGEVNFAAGSDAADSAVGDDAFDGAGDPGAVHPSTRPDLEVPAELLDGLAPEESAPEESAPEESAAADAGAASAHSSPNSTSQQQRSEPMTNHTPSSTLVHPQSSGANASVSARYERQEEIGTGGIGTVYRARQVRLGRDVAIKEVRDIFNVFAGVQRDDIIARFTDIVQTQARLLHPNIIQIVDLETDGEFPFVVTQYAPNGNLRRLIDVEGRPPLSVALKYFLQVLHALNAAHDQGIVHGSIKPENVVLDASGNALLSDFGIARVVEREGGRGNQVYVGVGTVAYMSPEQFQDPNTATVKSDIYSLGIMLYEMLTGKVPGRRSPMPSSFYPDIPRTLDDIFDRMSMDREEDRFNTIDEILAELYSSSEVMDILDKRSGVLFLRDPLIHGEAGLVHATFEPAEASAAADSAQVGYAVAGTLAADDFAGGAEAQGLGEASSSDLSEASDADSEAEVSVAGEVEGEEGAGDAASESLASESSASDVLGKLDKYGAMFEED